MRRDAVLPRPDWPAKVEALGFAFHTDGATPYWLETACYAFTEAEIDALETATNALHALALEAADRLIRGGDLERLAIPERFWPWIAQSWRQREPGLYGRFDLAFDGNGPPKLLEYNADTPTCLLEAAVVQWHWLEEMQPDADQFNSIHERLIEAWKPHEAAMRPGGTVHFTGIFDELEDAITLDYMRDVCQQAGWHTDRITAGR